MQSHHELSKELPSELIEEFVIAAHGDEAKVREMHAHEPFLLYAVWDKFDESALQAASHMGNRSIAQYLLSQGALPDICAASMLGMTDVVARLLQDDHAQAGAKGAHGITIMYHAALGGKPEIAEMLVTSGGGAGVDQALHAATLKGHTDMVRWLLDHGVENVNATNFDNKTPLQVAIEKDHTEIADMLREHGGTEQQIP